MSSRDEAGYFSARLARNPRPVWGRFRPFCLVCEMGAPVSLAHPWMAFDSFMAHLVLLDGLGEDFFITPKKRDLACLGAYSIPPLAQTGDVYHGSVSIFEPEPEGYRVTSIYKRFEEAGTERLRQKRIYMGQGYFRAYVMRKVYVPARRVVFYGCGDVDAVARLVRDYVVGLGDDFRIGFGVVRSWRIEEMPEDWSLVRDGIAMRPIPVDMCDEYEDAVYLAYKPPYWNPRNVALCVPPGARCKLKRDSTA